MRKDFSIIVALDSNRGIGRGGQLPWHIPEDLKHFKTVTCRTMSEGKKNAVIMGRKTWESIPEAYRPLKGRVNVVLTRNSKYPLPEDVLVFHGLNEALTTLSQKSFLTSVENVFVIGGAEIFEEAIDRPECKKLYLTEISHAFPCDRFFPPFQDSFKKVSSTPPKKQSDLVFSFSEWEKIDGE